MRKYLEEWRLGHRHEYRTAYVSQSLPAILAPLAEVELAEWDMLWNGYGVHHFGSEVSMALLDEDGEEEKEEDEPGRNATPMDESSKEQPVASESRKQASTAAERAFYCADRGGCVFPLTDLIWIGELAEFAADEHHPPSPQGKEVPNQRLQDHEDQTGPEWGAPPLNAIDGSTLSSAALRDPDPDSSLVPRMVALAVVPRLLVRLREAYDPLSRSQTRCFVGCVGELLDFLDHSGAREREKQNNQESRIQGSVSGHEHERSLAELLMAPLEPLAEAVNALCVPIAAFSSRSGQVKKKRHGPFTPGVAFMVRQICFGIKLLRNACAWAALLDHELVGKHSAHRKYGKSMPMVASTAKEKRSTNHCALSELAVGALTTVKLVPALLQLARLGYIDEALELTEALASALTPRFDSFRRRRHQEEGDPSTWWEIAVRSDDTRIAFTRLLSVFEGAAPAGLSQRDMGTCDRKGDDARVHALKSRFLLL